MVVLKTAEFKIGDRIEIINNYEDEWTRKGAKGEIIDISLLHKSAKVLCYSGDYDPGSWWIHNENMRKIPKITKKYKLTIEK